MILEQMLELKRFLQILVDQAEEYRMAMIEAIAETDEELMEKYLEGEEITADELHEL